jgi:hypothetical protein
VRLLAGEQKVENLGPKIGLEGEKEPFLEGEKEPVRLQIQESQKVPSGRRRRTANAKRQGQLNTEAEHGS